jgi:medium-chain acyl-[acyl-carrier-protein] hydrolase
VNLESWLFHPTYPRCTDNLDVRLRMFCLPHAGGNAMLYRPWRHLFPAGVDICPIELPGRGARLREPAFTRMSELIDVLVEVLEPLLSVPFAFFGHSMGAAIAFEAAKRLRRAGGPVHLFASGRPAPDRTHEPRALHRLPDTELVLALARLGGTPAEVLARDDMIAALLPCIRADLELIETYVPTCGEILSCPITALAGSKDEMIDRRSLDAWSRFTSGGFRVHVFSGGHFYLAESAPSVVAEILRDLHLD